MKKRNENKCGDCAFSKGWLGPEFNHWNVNPNGQPITLHCHFDETKVKRGVFPSDEACKNFKRKV